jgi:hypothetical protein
VVAVDPIARQYAESTNQFWEPECFPWARPPFDTCCIEWNGPSQTLTENGMVQEPPHQHAVFCRSEMITEKKRRELRHRIDDIESQLKSEWDTAAAIRDSAVLVNNWHMMHVENRVVLIPVVSHWLIREDGLILYTFHSNDDDTDPRHLVFASMGGVSHWHVCWMAFSFMNAKNVKLLDVTEELQPEPKIRRRLRIPDVRRWTLSIDGRAEKPRREFGHAPQADAESFTPFHLVRGTFATYTADKPLFGNPKLVGRFWRPPHARGKKENGEVVKDYRIDPPHEVSAPHTQQEVAQ